MNIEFGESVNYCYYKQYYDHFHQERKVKFFGIQSF